MAEATRAEVDADPDPALLVLHQVDVVVARADRAELRRRQLGELSLRHELGLADLLQHRVVDPLLGRTRPCRTRSGAMISRMIDSTPPSASRSRCVSSVRSGLVAAADVVADARRRHVALVGDATADRLAVAGVVVGAEHAELGVAGRHAPLELLQAPLVDGAERLDRAHRFLLSFCRERHRADSNRRSALCRRAPRRSATVS